MSTTEDELVLAHFIVSDDVERSRRFYTDVLGGRTVIGGEAGDQVTYVALANSWIIINRGGGPTEDKPTVVLEPPTDPDRVSSFLNLRVADVHALYEEWTARGAQFVTPPIPRETETFQSSTRPAKALSVAWASARLSIAATLRASRPPTTRRSKAARKTSPTWRPP